MTNNDSIKAELHNLVDGLDIAEMKKQYSIQHFISRGNDITNCVDTLFDDIHYWLTSFQKPVEKSLEEKLKEVGFEDYRFNPVTSFKRGNIKVIYDGTRTIVSHDNSSIQTRDDSLICNSDDHEQVLRDIRFLESRYSGKNNGGN